MPRGKAKEGAPYVRELRTPDQIPESRTQIEKFIKNHNKELKHLIQETTEHESDLMWGDSDRADQLAESSRFENQDLTLADSEDENEEDWLNGNDWQL